MVYTVSMRGAKPIILAVITALILKLFVFDFIVAQGLSMEPSIHDGSVLVINRLRYGFQLPWGKYLVHWALPKIGDVVIFKTPEGEIAVKRCVSVSEKSVFAQGDNSLASYDSRSYGAIPLHDIIGKVLGY